MEAQFNSMRDYWKPFVNLNFVYKKCSSISSSYSAPFGQSKSQHLPLVILHGLFGNSKNFFRFSDDFKGDRDIFLVDMRNHGLSEWFAFCQKKILMTNFQNS